MKFETGIQHHLVDTLQDPNIPGADFIFGPGDRLPKRCGLPLVLVQGYRIFPREIEEHVYRLPHPKVCIARWLVDVGLQLGVPAQQLVHVPYGKDTLRYKLTRPLDQRPLQISMLYNEHPMKGSQHGIAVLAQVRQRIPNLKVVLFGAQLPSVSIPEWVRFHENPDREVIVNEIYNGSRIFLSPSITEGFGFTAVEAMCCGCALVVTDNGGSADYAFDGQTALVSKPKDVDTMARHVESLLLDDELRQRIARQGNACARKFNWDESARLLEDFLNRYGQDPFYYQGH